MDVVFCMICILIMMVAVGQAAKGNARCSWSNEHCSSDKECCSESCYRAFEGTNPRCRHSTLGEPCIFAFHCADDLECGPKFNCCSPYWKMCTADEDCCDPMHVCKPADGFYYDRCLYPSSAISVLTHLGNSPLYIKHAAFALGAILVNRLLTMKSFFPECIC